MGLSCNGSEGTGEWCTLAHVDRKKRRYAGNEITLPVKEFDALTIPHVTDTLAPQDVRRRSQNNEENR